MLRRLVLAVSIAYFGNIPALQVGLQIFQSAFLVTYYIVVKPYNAPMFNGVEIMNELCLLTGSYLLIEFTEFEEDAIFRYKVGWVLTGIMAFTTLANMSCLFYKVGLVVVPKIKALINKCS